MIATEPALTPHGYLIAGTTYPRVSSILGVLAKPGLEAWRRKVGPDEADRIMRTASDFGTRTHAACERIARGEPAPRVVDALRTLGTDDVVPLVEAFARWFDASVADVIGVERMVWSEQYGYAGTADLLVTLRDGRRMVADIKTSRSLSESYRLQLEAYRLALEEHGEPFDGRLIVWLPSSHPGIFAEREYADHPVDRRAWRACLALWKWQRDTRDEWKIDKQWLEAIVDASRT